jgi:hypothetical protein
MRRHKSLKSATAQSVERNRAGINRSILNDFYTTLDKRIKYKRNCGLMQSHMHRYCIRTHFISDSLTYDF